MAPAARPRRGVRRLRDPARVDAGGGRIRSGRRRSDRLPRRARRTRADAWLERASWCSVRRARDGGVRGGRIMAKHPIRFGVQTGQQSIEWAQMLELWQKADAWGYDSLWNFDHFYPIFVDPEGPCFESWTTLSALAQATKRARIGALVNGNTYRHPCLTAKMAATLDHTCGGRVTWAIGAGWSELEHQNFGIAFKTVPGRLAALDEACRIILGMMTQAKTTVHGKHYTVTDAMCLPKPLQQPHPPIM